MAANLLTVRPPPQPTSSTVDRDSTVVCVRPQSVSFEWLLFMRHRVKRPSSPVGFLHCVSCVVGVLPILITGMRTPRKLNAPRHHSVSPGRAAGRRTERAQFCRAIMGTYPIVEEQ